MRRAGPRITAAQPYSRATRRAAAQMSARASSLLTHPTAPAARAACSIPSSSDALTSSTRHAGARIELAQALEHLEAVDVGHAQVEQHHVGPQALDGVERRLVRRRPRRRARARHGPAPRGPCRGGTPGCRRRPGRRRSPCGRIPAHLTPSTRHRALRPSPSPSSPSPALTKTPPHPRPPATMRAVPGGTSESSSCMRPSSPGRRRPPQPDSAGSQGRIVPREAPRIAGPEGRPDERAPSDRMTRDPTARRRSTTFGADGGARHHACAAFAGGRTPHEAPRTRPRRASCSSAPRRRAAWPPPSGRSPGSPTATARRERSSSRCRTTRRPPWSPSAASRTRCSRARRRARRSTASTSPSCASSSTASRRATARGSVLVRLTSDLDDDAWLPGMTELSHVLGSLQRHESGEAEAALNELRMQNAELVTALATLSQRERQLVALNRELADTNRAVTALLAELGQQAQELRERAAGNASFLGSLTHELRTPLYAVRGMTEAILREGGDRLEPRLREDVRLIDGAMEEALDLVNDHLDLARLAAGREVVRVADVHVDELFSALRGIVVHLPRSPGVTVVFEDLNGVPTLRTDAFKLSQILRNYVVNGLKFTERGEVRVSAVAVDAGMQVRFAVSDTGPGLDRHRPVAHLRGVRPARAPGRGRRAARLGPGPVDLQAPGDPAGRRGRRHQRAGPRHDLHGHHPGGLHPGKRGRGGRRGGLTRGPRGRPKVAYNRRPRSRPPRSGSRSIQCSAGWCNGSTTASGVVSLGSSPSPAAGACERSCTRRSSRRHRRTARPRRRGRAWSWRRRERRFRAPQLAVTRPRASVRCARDYRSCRQPQPPSGRLADDGRPARRECSTTPRCPRTAR